MPWPMVHFAISQRLSDRESSPELLIGSIAPDSLHIRGQITREEKGMTHLVHNNQLPSKELIIRTMHMYLPQRPDLEWKEFVLGYFSHIYTDLRWTDTLYTDFERTYKTEADDNIRRVYNQEVSQVEFDLLQTEGHTEQLFKTLLKAQGYTIDPFVTMLEIQKYRDTKVKWLQDPMNNPQITLMYFQMDKVNAFIENTAGELRELIQRED